MATPIEMHWCHVAKRREIVNANALGVARPLMVWLWSFFADLDVGKCAEFGLERSCTEYWYRHLAQIEQFVFELEK